MRNRRIEKLKIKETEFRGEIQRRRRASEAFDDIALQLAQIQRELEIVQGILYVPGFISRTRIQCKGGL